MTANGDTFSLAGGLCLMSSHRGQCERTLHRPGISHLHARARLLPLLWHFDGAPFPWLVDTCLETNLARNPQGLPAPNSLGSSQTDGTVPTPQVALNFGTFESTSWDNSSYLLQY
eukprot:scaffold26571_cov52-Attheya_sp.AAC.4